MEKRLYSANWPYDATEEDIRSFFANYSVEHVKMVNDRETQKFRGFCFVEVSSEDEAQKAIAALNGLEFGGRNIKVAKAEPQPESHRNGGGRGRDDRDRDRRGGNGHGRDRDREGRGRRY